MHKTTPNLSHLVNVPTCNYDRIISENRLIYSYRDEIFNIHNIRPGGEFIPSECNAAFSTAIIVPYRDRAEQLKSFITYIHNFLRLQQIHYRIFLIEQVDKKPFNRAKLFNIGSNYAIKAKFPCLIFHDVDLFPMNLGNLYACNEQPRHMATNIDKNNFEMPYKDYVGGSISMKTEVFQSINGMSNLVSMYIFFSGSGHVNTNIPTI